MNHICKFYSKTKLYATRTGTQNICSYFTRRRFTNQTWTRKLPSAGARPYCIRPVFSFDTGMGSISRNNTCKYFGTIALPDIFAQALNMVSRGSVPSYWNSSSNVIIILHNPENIYPEGSRDPVMLHFIRYSATRPNIKRAKYFKN